MDKAVAAKQTGERVFLKDILRSFAAIHQAFPSDVEVSDATALLKKKFIERRNEEVAKIHETRRPVIHHLKVENGVSFGSLKYSEDLSENHLVSPSLGIANARE